VRGTLALAALIVLTALCLRISIASVPPVLDEIRRGVPLGGAAAGILTTLPVLCMGVGAPLALVVARRVGLAAGLALVCLAIAVGILLRVPGGVVPLMIGTALAGLGIAAGNVLVPSLIKEDFQDRVGLTTGAYTMALTAGGALAAGLTVPIEDVVGGGWQAALAVWAVPALLGALLWGPRAARGIRRMRGGLASPTPAKGLWRQPLAWQVTGYIGFQSLGFYSVLSWLPAILRDQGLSRATAGALLSVVLIAGMPAALIAPSLAARRRSQRPAVVFTVGLLAVGMLGVLLVSPRLALVWPILIGTAQGSSLGLMFLFFAMRSRDSTQAGQLAAMAQTVGYLIAAVGPLAVGLIHELTGGWTWSLIFLIAALVPMLACGWRAGADRTLRHGSPP
jgi:CP family cyanate transporter-like MFS transporter